MQSRPLRTYKRLIAASLFALLLSTGASVFFFKKWSDAEDWYRAVKIEKDNMEHKYNSLQRDFEKTYGNITVMHNENNCIFFLQAVDSTKKYRARIYWNRYTHETHIDIENLPAAPVGKQYQLWAYFMELPLNAGLIEINDDAYLISMKNIDKADGWAVTLEPKGGSPEPTKDQTYLLAKN